MKKTIKLALVAAMALGATSAYATNGDHLIGIGAKSRGMGGVSIGMSHGAESGIANPALITSVEGTEVSFGGTLFMPDITTTMSNPMGGDQPSETSAADMSMIPSVSIANKVNDNFYWGVGMWGTAGMGVDYRDGAATATNSANMQMVTNLQLMQFGVPLAYKIEGFSIGITPLLQYGALDINYNFGGQETGEGVSQDLAFGFNVGAAYEIAGVTIGALYKSAIEMEYNGQLSSATGPFVQMGIFPGAMADTLEQPAEIGIGVSYAIAGNTIALDYKQVKWGDAAGYKDFNWQNQDVVALGYEYAADSWAVRLGYNYAEQPIEEMQSGPAMMVDATSGSFAQAGGNAINTMNLLGFPATTESHITLGGTYEFSKQISLDGAFTYAPETETTMKTITGYSDAGTALDPTDDMLFTGDTTVKHSQSAVSVQVNYTF
jgi:long-chain fatty acid transport protein